MQRILILGCSGAGKSTLARELGRVLDLPVIHLDREHWRPGWREPPDEHWAAKVRELARRPVWIIDGNYGGTMSERIERADAVVFLDLPRWRCLGRVVRRRIRYHRRTRPDMGPGCPEKIDLEFLHWIWSYRRTQRPAILRRLEARRDRTRIITLATPREIRRFLTTIKQEHPPPPGRPTT